MRHEESPTLRYFPAPHLHEGTTTAGIMFSVVLCLLPAGIWGVLLFGPRALYVLLVSVAGSLLTELAVAGLLLRRFTLADGSALLTGLLLGYSMPPAVPLFIPAVASFFAIAVIKMTFGGLGGNWMNPALGARVFVQLSWMGPMSAWRAPLSPAVDALSAATPLGLAKTALSSQTPGMRGPIDLVVAGLHPSGMGAGPLSGLLDRLGRLLPEGYGDLLVGRVAGSIGEVSAFLLLLGSIYLLVKKIIAWEIPAAYLGSFGLAAWAFGGLPFGAGLFRGDAAFHLLTGGLLLGALFMATDPVTSPMKRPGRIVFGLGCGLLTFVLRIWGSQPEGVALAIVLVNMFVPLLNRLGRRVVAKEVHK
jgi:electron transport complex protein RnfD